MTISIISCDLPMKGKKFSVLTVFDRETVKVGKKIAAYLTKGDIISLVGDLGSGKTQFAKGLALGLGVSQDIVITSPSFSLVNEYEGNYSFYHMDLYRLTNLSETLLAEFEDYFNNDGVIAIEWADRWPGIIHEQTIKVEIIIIDEQQREIILSGGNQRGQEIIEAVGTEFGTKQEE